MFEGNLIKLELRDFFNRKYRLAVLALASFISLC
jgi:hypothetical protein